MTHMKTTNPKRRRHDRWLIEKTSYTNKPWRTVAPIDPCSDCVGQKQFATHGEALTYAVREATKTRLQSQFEELLDSDNEKILRWWWNRWNSKPVTIPVPNHLRCECAFCVMTRDLPQVDRWNEDFYHEGGL